MMIYRTTGGGEQVEQKYQEVLERWPVPAERVLVPTREGETFVFVFGRAGAPPLVAIHGSGANATNWMANAVEMAEHHRVYAVDVIGEPGLSAPNRPQMGSEAYARWLDDVLTGLGLTSPVALMGMSLGGWFSIDYASRRPERVSRLALLTPAGVGKRPRGLLLKLLAMTLAGERGLRKSVKAALGDDVQPEVVDALVLIFKHFKPRMRIPTFTDDELRRLTMPVSVIVGDRDPMLDTATTAQRFREVLPHASVHVVAAGHDLTAQVPAAIAFTASGT
ncbi:alpha/beta fold hydrolase [Allokutzneria albata]|uniref:Pimeloyl-ACP methyl ester carboxylesterase n=1 Tax=Allokutzneria albata TaxID=211114 RepID=A0A1G9TCY0_ALLAB|nr:alpha/beta hydrolase [Allokutzneria albata]SDM45488.1 Pimeloyl-ACP methyl ester carboxylesterase [Allokutzneria albata]